MALGRAVQFAPAEAPRLVASDSVHINCSVAGLVNLILADKSVLPVQLNVGAWQFPYRVVGVSGSGNSGTWSVYGMFAG